MGKCSITLEASAKTQSLRLLFLSMAGVEALQKNFCLSTALCTQKLVYYVKGLP